MDVVCDVEFRLLSSNVVSIVSFLDSDISIFSIIAITTESQARPVSISIFD